MPFGKKPAQQGTEASEGSTCVLPLQDGQRIVLPNSLGVSTTVVIREQGKWFEEELQFVGTNIAQEGWTVLDIGDTLGRIH
jgi:hypothetical protein